MTGFALTRSLPPKIDLTNTGEEPVERIRSGRWEPAHQRFAKIAGAAIEDDTDPPRIPPIRRRNDVAEAPSGGHQ
ncbi:hypothetical protein C8K38_103224 [Rhodococcus sp. OK611]|nr:hypothetical protein C8K38_103224 [Rhodococcus sp. OK611]SNX90168.1 hypothetical protein SAMN05447004_104224 [Rhodococcus sp. OK270]